MLLRRASAEASCLWKPTGRRDAPILSPCHDPAWGRTNASRDLRGCLGPPLAVLRAARTRRRGLPCARSVSGRSSRRHTGHPGGPRRAESALLGPPVRVRQLTAQARRGYALGRGSPFGIGLRAIAQPPASPQHQGRIGPTESASRQHGWGDPRSLPSSRRGRRRAPRGGVACRAAAALPTPRPELTVDPRRSARPTQKCTNSLWAAWNGPHASFPRHPSIPVESMVRRRLEGVMTPSRQGKGESHGTDHA